MMKALYTGATSNNFINGKIYIIKVLKKDGKIIVKNLYGKEKETYNSFKDMDKDWKEIIL